MKSPDVHAPTIADESRPEGLSLVPAPELLANRYEILGLLGSGGMGAVYRARDRELDELVALKMLRRELVALPEMLERFRREVKLARKVTHANVARTFDIGEHDGERFLTMELVDGESLSTALARERTLPLARTIEIARATCEGLAAAHAAGVTHRDLKPDNILLGKDGSVKITDFGIAKVDADVRMTQGAVGTPAYMAPEQVMGTTDVDARADVYALGAMLFEMVTGDLPFDGTSTYAIAAARLVKDAPDPRTKRADLPAPLAELIVACMARDPARRPAGAKQVSDALAKISLSGVQESLPVLRAAAPAPQAGLKSVAVLPLKNLGPAEDGYLAEGLTDDLSDRLSMTPELRVCSRGAVASVRETDPRRMGEELGVHVFVEGSVRRVGDRVRISARLVSVQDGFQLWAQRFEGEARELLKLGDAAADAIANALTVERKAPGRATTVDPEALDLYLRGRNAYHTFSSGRAGDAVRFLRAAHERAPDDPTVLAGYAMALVRAAAFASELADSDDAIAVAESAVRLGPNVGDAHLALAALRFHASDFAGAGAALRRALELAPSSGEANALFGRILCETGHLDDGILRLRLARSLDPRLEIAFSDEARAHMLRGDWDAALALIETTVPDPQQAFAYWFSRARFALWKRDQEYALRLTQFARQLGMDQDPRVGGVIDLVTKGKADFGVLEWFARANTGAKLARRRATYFHQLTAEARMLTPDVDLAMAAVEAADENGLIDLAWLDACPLLEPLRRAGRLQAVRAHAAARAEALLSALGYR